MNNEILSRDEAASFARISVKKIDREIRAGNLVASHIGCRVVIRRERLKEWLLKLETPSVTEQVTWIDASARVPASEEEVLVCFKSTASGLRSVTMAVYEPSEDGESPWYVDGHVMDFGPVIAWAEKPSGQFCF